MLAQNCFVLACVFAAASARDAGDEQVLGDLGRVLQSGPVRAEPAGDAVTQASRVTRDLASMQPPFAPFRHERIDPIPIAAASSCDRDYAQSCPGGWLGVGEIHGASHGSFCAAAVGDSGPCAGEAFSFDAMPVQAKERWSGECLANWPCRQCERDFRSCPIGWSQAEGSFACSPLPSYRGPCHGVSDFRGYTVDMLTRWSSACGAFWPCSPSGRVAST